MDLPIFQYACLEPAPDQADQTRISDSVFHEAEQPSMIKAPEEVLQIRLQHPPHLATGDQSGRSQSFWCGHYPLSATDQLYPIGNDPLAEHRITGRTEGCAGSGRFFLIVIPSSQLPLPSIHFPLEKCFGNDNAPVHFFC